MIKILNNYPIFNDLAHWLDGWLIVSVGKHARFYLILFMIGDRLICLACWDSKMWGLGDS